MLVRRGDTEIAPDTFELDPQYLVEPSNTASDVFPPHLLPSVLEVWEFTNFFSIFFGCKKLLWGEFQAGLTDDSCALFHGMHVTLVRIIFQDLSSDEVFKGRPLNALTWPELLREYMVLVQIEHAAENMEVLSKQMDMPDVVKALEARSYDDLPFAARLKIPENCIDIAMNTAQMRAVHGVPDPPRESRIFRPRDILVSYVLRGARKGRQDEGPSGSQRSAG